MRVVTQRLVEQLSEAIREKILNLELQLGSRVDLRQLASEFGVSVTPVREALHRLSWDGLVEIAPRQGYYVFRPSIKDLNDTFDLRKLLEVYALEYAIKSNLDLQALSKLKEEMKRALRETDKQVKRRQHDITDSKLHLWIIQNSTNTKLYELYSNIGNFIRISHSLDRGWNPSLREHIELIEAILSGDIETAKDVLIKHIENARKKGIRNLKSIYSSLSICRGKEQENSLISSEKREKSY